MLEVVRQPPVAVTLLASASQEVRDMIAIFKKDYMKLKSYYEKIKVQMHKEGFSDPEIHVVMDHVMKDLPITIKERRNFLKDLRPIKDMTGLEKISGSTAREELTTMRCQFKDVDKDVKRAKRRLIDAIDESKEWFDIQIMGTIVGFVSDQQE